MGTGVDMVGSFADTFWPWLALRLGLGIWLGFRCVAVHPVGRSGRWAVPVGGPLSSGAVAVHPPIGG